MSTIQTITSSAKILVNPVVLKLFQTADLINELGTISNPVIFTGAIAGNITLLPVNPLLLYNDKDGTFQSVDFNIPLITNARLASAFILAFCRMSIDDLEIKSWDEYR